MSMRIGTAAAVLCDSLYLYVVCIVSEGGTLFLLRICASVLSLRVPFIHVRANSYAPIGCTSQEKNLRGKTNLASIPDDRCNSSARIRMRCVIVLY